MRAGEYFITSALHRRQKAGKESIERFDERFGTPSIERPEGGLVWVHAASVGEAQSALILIKTLLQHYNGLNVLVTTGTLTSAHLMEKNLPEGAFHQFYPVDHPDWVSRFLDHWAPDFILWMESELWPNMLLDIQKREIPAMLINARLSERSYKRWKLLGGSIRTLLKGFSTILCQTEKDAQHFSALGAHNVHVTDNIKYSAQSLRADEQDLKAFNAIIAGRPTWVYASTHDAEEEIAARIHEILKASLPEVLSVIVPRHPERRGSIAAALDGSSLNVLFRGEDKTLPAEETDIYIADTLGELGLFYRASSVTCIGRTFSKDGGGGHNPIEAAQLNCAILHGPHVQNLQEIFDEMNQADAAIMASTEQSLADRLQALLSDPKACSAQQKKAYDFAKNKERVLETVMAHIHPHLETLETIRKKAS
ncbi:MAG: 3-deoxy-D-manno-octulosonic acid transferase [Pseudomonadota bacterium]